MEAGSMADTDDMDDLGDGLHVFTPGQVSVNLGPLPSFPGYLFRQAQVRVYHGLQPIFAPFGVRPTQFGVMILLRYNPGIRPSEVASALGLKRANFVPLLDDLRERGLAETLPRPDDRRSRALYLTDAGLELLTRLEAKVQEYEYRVLELIDPEKTGVLANMVKVLEEMGYK
jgi:DNA-binding MarR family transcriptional regulator